MMNIVQLQDALKDFSDDQLVKEMQQPSGSAPPYLVLTEIERREKARKLYQSNQQPQATVAEEAVMGKMNQGLGMMAPQQSANAPSPQPMRMRSGGLTAFGRDLSREISQDSVDPFLDEVEQMAQQKFNVDFSNSDQGLGLDMSRPAVGFGGTPQPIFSQPLQEVNQMPYPAAGSKGGARIQPQNMFTRALRMNDGGVVKYQDRGYVPSSELLRAIAMQESGMDPTARGAAGEVGMFQIMPTTAISPGYGIPSMFPDLDKAVADGVYPSYQAAYEANKEIVDAALLDPAKSEQFAKNYLDVAKSRFPDDEARAIASYNVGMGGAENLKDPLSFPYVQGVGSFVTSPDETKTPVNIPGISVAQASTGDEEQSSGGIYGNVSFGNMVDSLMDFFETGDAQSGIGAMADENRKRLIQSGLYNRENMYDTEGEAEGQALIQRRNQRISQLEQQAATGNPLTMGVILDEFLNDQDPEVAKRARAIMSEYQSQQIEAPVAAETVNAPRPENVPQQSQVATKTPAEKEAEEKAEEAQAVAQTQSDIADLYAGSMADTASTVGAEGDSTSGTTDKQSYIQMLMDNMSSREDAARKEAEFNKLMALAKFGAGLATSTSPTFLGAVGEAAGTGIDALTQAGQPLKDVESARTKLLGSLAEAELTAASKGSITREDYFKEASKLEQAAADALDPALRETLMQQAQMYRLLAGVPSVGGGSSSGISAESIAAEKSRRGI